MVVGPLAGAEDGAGGGPAARGAPIEQRLRLALAAGRLGVWEYDIESGSVSWDPVLEQMCGFEPGTFGGTFDDYRSVLHPDDRDEVFARVDAAVRERRSYTVEHRIVRPDGSVGWIQGDGQPVVHDGVVRGLIGVTRDVTERHEAEAERRRLLEEEAAARSRLEFLADAASTMSESLELTERLRELGRLAVPRFADASVVYLLDDAGQLQLIALHHRDAEQEAVLRDLVRRYPPRLDAPVGVGFCVREGRTTWLPKITDDLLELAARSEEHLAALRALRLSGGLAVPLIAKEGAFGAVAFVTVEGRLMSEDDVGLIEELCRRVSVHVYNGQLIEARELERAATRYQAALLQALFEASVDGMVAVDLEGRVLAHNHRFLEMWGVDEALVAEGDDALVEAVAPSVVDPDAFRASVRSAYAQLEAVHEEVVLADGRIFDRHGTPILAEDGQRLGFTWSNRDVTVERLQQAEVVAAGERFATLARTLQQSLLPPTLPSPAGIDLAARYHPALEGVEVGGDFYDVFAVGEDWILVIGDVCGKGAQAAALTALVRYTVRAVAIHDPDPGATLRALNTAMLSHTPSPERSRRFATVCCIRLRPSADGVVADVACGGHPAPIVVRADGSIETSGVPGTLLGVFEDVNLTTASVALERGDSLVAVTDGVLEARDASGQLFDADGLAAFVAALAGQPAAELSAAIEQEALRRQGGVARDDIAILVTHIADLSGAR